MSVVDCKTMNELCRWSVQPGQFILATHVSRVAGFAYATRVITIHQSVRAHRATVGAVVATCSWQLG